MVTIEARWFGLTSAPRMRCCSEKPVRSALNIGGEEAGKWGTATSSTALAGAVGAACAAVARGRCLRGVGWDLITRRTRLLMFGLEHEAGPEPNARSLS